MRIYAGCVEEVGGEAPDVKSGAEMSGTDWQEASAVTPCCSLRIRGAELMKEHPVMVQRVLLVCLEKIIPHRKDVTARHILALTELLQKGGSKEQFLPCGIKAYMEYGTLTLTKESELVAAGTQTICPSYEIKPPMEVRIPGTGKVVFTVFEPDSHWFQSDFSLLQQNILQNRYTKCFDYDKIKGIMVLRTRQQGDYLTIDGSLREKSVKQYMIDEKIPKSQRGSIYLLADDAHVMWIPGYRISERYKVDVNTKRILQVSIRGGRNGRES
jgi:tRNA(Ile)-lysidine synthase